MKKEEKKFFVCKHCGNMVGFIYNSGVPLICCGEEMNELVPNTTDASVEKHVPVIKVDGSRVIVEISSLPHPMVEEHYICWVYIETKKGGQRKSLFPGEKACVEFVLTEDDSMESAYAYCNLHGLWKASVVNQ